MSVPNGRPPAWPIWVALGTVYVVWSTTYLAIRIANETLPPLVAAGTRFVIAGLVLLALTTVAATPPRNPSAARSGGPPSRSAPS